MNELLLQGSYGRYYESKKEAIRDWEAGLDFKIINGPYTSVRDLEYLTANYDKILIKTKQGFVDISG